MNFISFTFLVFLAVVYSVYWKIPAGEWRKYFLVAASYVFYAWWDWRFCGLMVLVTGNAYATGQILARLAAPQQLRVLWASIALDLAVLGFFKYYGFFVANAGTALTALGLDVPLPMLAVVLPIGISFYTFHAISYVVDVYRGKASAERSPINVALYIAFFPQLVAGPIVRAAFFMPQLQRVPPYVATAHAHGARLILRGVICKAVIADTLAQICDPVFADIGHYNDRALIIALLAFYGQIYFDFAGYSDIAIGTARLFGYRIPKNFDRPYASASLTEFWRRWHMSLSFWLRDYVYIPLGGNRGSPLAFYRNLLATMLLGGLWHGASWNFVIWGGLHGLGLCGHKLWLELRPRLGDAIDWNGVVWRVTALVLTQLWVLCAWAFFRADSFADALEILKATAGFRHHEGSTLSAIIVVWIVAVIGADHLLRRTRWRADLLPGWLSAGWLSAGWLSAGWSGSLFWAGLGAIAAIAIGLMPIAPKPFIYFRF